MKIDPFIVAKKCFFDQDTVVVAHHLIGMWLLRIIDGKTVGGIITETEAYKYLDDPASHAYRGVTKRTEPMFGPTGHAYVYFIYGNHFCFNVVAKEKSATAGAVLIRGIKPVYGVEYMQAARGGVNLKQLSNGPGKVTQALQINKQHSGMLLSTHSGLFIAQGVFINPDAIQKTPRIGISVAKDKLWRFYIKEEQVKE